MSWIGVIVQAVLAVLKALYGAPKPVKENASETDEDADIGDAIADPGRLPDPDKLLVQPKDRPGAG